MQNPYTRGTTDSTEAIDQFIGLDQRERISVGELAHTLNCSSRRYPTLSPRYERGITEGHPGISCMISKGHLCFIKGNKLYVNFTEVATLPTSTQKRRMVGMGAYIIVFPDGYYYNTEDSSDKGNIEKTFNVAGSVAYTLCNSQGDGITATSSGTAPTNPTDGQYWIDTSVVPNVLKRWSAIYSSWTQIPSTFTKIAYSGIGSLFDEMDSVTISGSTVVENGSYAIYHKDSGYIVIPYLLNQVATRTENMTVKRAMPPMDFVVESGNRLWGCKYGRVGGQTVNEIYASALGNFKVWNRYLGISTDSYAASRGSDGPWTGAVNYLGTPIFFKENTIETVYPSTSGAHEIQAVNINGTGVAPGAADSIAVVNGVVYYQGVDGFYSYTGSLPKKISDPLGDHFYEDSVAGDLADHYYVCAREGEEYNVFVYQTELGIWYREDSMQVTSFCRVGSELFFTDGVKLYTARATMGTKETKVGWSAITHDFCYSTPEDTNVQRVSVRAHLEKGATLTIQISYDGSNKFSDVGTITGNGTSRYETYPIVPARCDHFRLRFVGNGDGCIWSVICKYDKGGVTK